MQKLTCKCACVTVQAVPPFNVSVLPLAGLPHLCLKPPSDSPFRLSSACFPASLLCPLSLSINLVLFFSALFSAFSCRCYSYLAHSSLELDGSSSLYYLCLGHSFRLHVLSPFCTIIVYLSHLMLRHHFIRFHFCDICELWIFVFCRPCPACSGFRKPSDACSEQPDWKAYTPNYRVDYNTSCTSCDSLPRNRACTSRRVDWGAYDSRLVLSNRNVCLRFILVCFRV